MLICTFVCYKYYVYESNMIIGMIDAGLSEKQVNSLLSALNIPLIITNIIFWNYILGATYSSNIGIDDIHDIQDIDISPIASSPLLLSFI